MAREQHPWENKKSIRKALSSEGQGMRNKNQVANYEKRAVDYGQQRSKKEQ